MNKTMAVKLCEVVGVVCESTEEGETDRGSFFTNEGSYRYKQTFV